jgi:hypothetical protein
MQQDFFTRLNLAARPQSPHAIEARRIKRVLAHHPDIISKAIALVEAAETRGATRVRTDWLIAELGMFYSVEIGNENREAIARLILHERPDLDRLIHLRTSKRADFLKRKEPRA